MAMSFRPHSRFIRSLRCWIGRHDDIIERGAGRLFLRCMECLRATPGWEIEDGTKRREDDAALSSRGARPGVVEGDQRTRGELGLETARP